MLKARTKQRRLAPFLSDPGKVLDIGSGNGALVHQLKQEGIQIQSVDIRNKSRFEDVQPIVYDGMKLPFGDHEFQTALLITMLHHTRKQEQILREAMRVARELVVMEDVYRNDFQKRLTFFVDSLVNWEFNGHPHSNKSDQGWKDYFKEQGLELVAHRKERFLLCFTQTIYHLRQPEAS